MISSIDTYVVALRQELHGADRALVQDAVADAREHLSNAVSAARESRLLASEHELLQTAIAAFGTPAEIALAYRQIERRMPVGSMSLAGQKQPRGGFLSVYRDIRAWSALLYMTLTIVVGYGYLMWVIFGLTFSISFAIFIIGLPLGLVFLLSIRGIALLEGRLIEALLGVRMPNRRVFFPRGTGWIEQFRILIKDKHTWLTMLYASSLWITGIGYFVLITFCTTLSFTLMATPIIQEVLQKPVLSLAGGFVPIPRWAYPVPVVGGFLLWTIFLHLCRSIGRLHGRWAKHLLVGEVQP